MTQVHGSNFSQPPGQREDSKAEGASPSILIDNARVRQSSGVYSFQAGDDKFAAINIQGMEGVLEIRIDTNSGDLDITLPKKASLWTDTDTHVRLSNEDTFSSTEIIDNRQFNLVNKDERNFTMGCDAKFRVRIPVEGHQNVVLQYLGDGKFTLFPDDTPDSKPLDTNLDLGIERLI